MVKEIKTYNVALTKEDKKIADLFCPHPQDAGSFYSYQ